MSLELRKLCKRVGADVHLHNVSLALEPGTFNVLLGPVDAGKTSILRLVAGLEQPSSGSIHLHGSDITVLDVRKRDVAFVYQEFINYPTLTVFENIASPMRVSKQPHAVIEATVDRLANMLGIDGLLERRPPSLSGGQQQRVAIARALAKDAEVVLLDEPFANLDYKLREELRRELPRLFEGSEKIVLYAATDPNEAFLLGGNTIVLDKGAVCQTGLADTIFAQPLNLVAAQTLSEFPLNLIAASLTGQSVSLNGHLSFPRPTHLCALPDGDYTLGFRAERLTLEMTNTASAKYKAMVVVTEITGNETIIHTQFAGESCVAVIDGTCEIVAGNPVDMFLDPYSLFAFDRSGRTVASPVIPYSDRARL